jgi:hypothetical protein
LAPSAAIGRRARVPRYDSDSQALGEQPIHETAADEARAADHGH